jgi:hypothetical protein
MHEEFFKNVDMMDRDQLLSQFSDIYKEKNGVRPHLDQSKWSDEDLRNAIKELALEESSLEETRSLRALRSLIREIVKSHT